MKLCRLQVISCGIETSSISWLCYWIVWEMPRLDFLLQHPPLQASEAEASLAVHRHRCPPVSGLVPESELPGGSPSPGGWKLEATESLIMAAERADSVTSVA